MNELISTQSGNVITSKLIAEITGKQHSDVMRDIRSLIEQLGDEKGECNFALSSYFGENQKNNPMYELSKKEALLLASGYNAVLRLKIIEKLEVLDRPRTHLEVLKSEMALLIEKERIQEDLLIANTKIEQDKPKVLFAETVTGSSNSILVRQFAKDLCNSGFEIGQNRVFEWLRKKGYLNSDNEPYQNYVSQGLFEVITRTIGGGNDTFTTKTTKITGKGQVYFAKKIKDDLLNN